MACLLSRLDMDKVIIYLDEEDSFIICLLFLIFSNSMMYISCIYANIDYGHV